jgi:hypothetical protein
MTPSWISRLTLILSLVVAGISFAQRKPGDRRRAYGEARAGIIESVLAILYPGAQVQWEPQLMVQILGDKPRTVEVPV